MRSLRIATLSLGLLGARPVSACTCAGAPPVDAARAAAELVVAGRIEEVGAADGPVGRWHPVRARVTVSRIWEGPDDLEITVFTSASGGSCGLDLERGQEWLLYAEAREPGYVVSVCSRSTRARIEAEAARLGPPRVERALPPIALRPLERALDAMDAAAVRAVLAAGDSVHGSLAGGRPIERAVAACAPDVVAAVVAGGAAPTGDDAARALDCPDPGAMIAALGPDRIEWTTALVAAAGRGDEARVEALLSAGVDPDRAHDPRPSPLAEAFARGRHGTADLLRRRGATVDRRALAGAMRSPDPVFRRLVYEADLTPDDATWLLPFAATDLELLELLLARGAHPAGPGAPHRPMLELALPCAPCVAALLDAGVAPDGQALRAAAGRRDLALVERLLASGAPVDAADPHGATALVVAVGVSGNGEVVDALLAAGADPNAISSFGTPLHAAAELSVVRRLLAAGADPSLEGKHVRWTPLQKAAGAGDLPRMRMLLEAGAPLDAGRPGERPLDSAAGRSLDAVELLLARGAPTGSALARAASADIVRRLLDAGADPNVPGFGGERALNHAARRRDPESVSLLLAAGADPDARDGRGSTPLLTVLSGPVGATEDRVVQIVDLLLAGGASKALRDGIGRTAADLATDQGRTALARRLALGQ